MDNFIWPTGPISFRMKSDLLFKHLLQNCEEVLHEMIASLLHIELSRIQKTWIMNPISLGDTIDDKKIILDVNLLMNDDTNIDLEMQVINYQDWIERSLFYTTRNFGDLRTGEPYLNAKASIHIGFLSFTLFEDRPKFYSRNMIQDIEDQHIYTDKLMIGVVDLTRLDLASETDQKYKVDKWARFFNAESWEDLRMLAEEYPVIEKAASYLKVLTEDEKYQLQQEAWEDNQRRINGIMQLKEQADARAKLAEASSRKDRAELKKTRSELKETKSELKETKSELAELKSQLADMQSKFEQYILNDGK